MKELLHKFDNGDSLDDRELRQLAMHLRKTEANLSKLAYPAYKLVLRDIREKLGTVDGYIEARKRRD